MMCFLHSIAVLERMYGRRRVVVTGMGMVSPIGYSVDESWQAALAGKSGIRQNKGFALKPGVKILAA